MPGDILKFLALVTVIGGALVAGVIFLVGDDGGGRNVCDQPLLPLTESEISQMAFQAEDAGLAKVIEAASRGDVAAAEETFSHANNGEIRSFTYDIDRPLREVDEDLAKDLCAAVNRIEEELTVDRRADKVAIDATRIRELIRNAAEALGYFRPGE